MNQPSTTVKEKVLEDGSRLKMVSWISGHVDPGRRMYQVQIYDTSGSTNFPTDFENFSKRQVRKFFDQVSTHEDITELKLQNPPVYKKVA